MSKKLISVQQIQALLNLDVLNGDDLNEKMVNRGYVGDVLSNVIAQAKPGDLWVTCQGHPNIIAVAVLKKLSAIIIVGKRQPEPVTIQKAKSEKVSLFKSNLPAFEVVGKIYQQGVSGIH